MKINIAIISIVFLNIPFEAKPAKICMAQNFPISEVRIEAGSYTAPAMLSAGYNTIRLINNDKEMHAAHLIRLVEGYTAEQLIQAYLTASREGLPRPAWMTHRGGVISGKGTAEVTLMLEPGKYVWVCVMGGDARPHFAGHEHQALEVLDALATDKTISLPPADLTITMQDDNHYLEDAPAVGQKNIDIVNAGEKYHLVALSKLHEGKKAEDMINWFQTYAGPPPAESVIATSAIGPGLKARITVDFEPGTYVLYCMANAEGQFHLMEGAYRTFTIN